MNQAIGKEKQVLGGVLLFLVEREEIPVFQKYPYLHPNLYLSFLSLHLFFEKSLVLFNFLLCFHYKRR